MDNVILIGDYYIPLSSIVYINTKDKFVFLKEKVKIPLTDNEIDVIIDYFSNLNEVDTKIISD